jgi:hypothetical protein
VPAAYLRLAIIPTIVSFADFSASSLTTKGMFAALARDRR